VAFCNSGSEATFNALRLARAVTGRPLIVKFQGAYHGWHDSVAMNVASPADRLGRPDPLSEGILEATIRSTLVARFNDIAELTRLFTEHGPQIAAVIIEPILHNVGCVPATPEFLAAAKSLCERHGSVLVFDEVITAFRHALGGYQQLTGVTPHLTAVGKAVANGYPIAALVGGEALMRHFRQRPVGNVFHGGTYNGHPVMAAAALATIDRLAQPGAYDQLYELGERYRADLAELVARHELIAQPAGFGSVWLLEFFTGPKSSYDDLLGNDAETDIAFRTALLECGHISSTVPLKRYNVTLAHTDEHRRRTMAAVDDVLTRLRG
jgi:glutamate-1-semialdehyde 2,1-aminomutase